MKRAERIPSPLAGDRARVRGNLLSALTPVLSHGERGRTTFPIFVLFLVTSPNHQQQSFVDSIAAFTHNLRAQR
jgi:hypothetical protein